MAPADRRTWPLAGALGLLGAACEGVPEPSGVEIYTDVEENNGDEDEADMDEMIMVVGGTVETKADVVAYGGESGS